MRLRNRTLTDLVVHSSKQLAFILACIVGLANSALGQAIQSDLDTAAAGSGEVINPINYDGVGEWGSILFRFQYHTQSYGEEVGQSAFGMNKTWLFDRMAIFADASFHIDNYHTPSPGAGFGVRFLYQDFFSASRERIFGASVWYDGDRPNNYFQQMGFSLESLGEKIDLRANLNLPIGKQAYATEDAGLGAPEFVGNDLLLDIFQFKQDALTAVDAEAAMRVGERNAWAFAGGYYLDGGGQHATGVKGGVRGYVLPDLSLSLTVANDSLFDTTVAFGLTWFLDWGTRGRARMAPICLVDRLREPVQRNDYVAVWSRNENASQPLTDLSGNPLFFVHVDSNAPAGGNGTVEHPFTTLPQAQNNSAAGNFIFLHSGSVFNAQSLAMKNRQSLLGEGATGGHLVDTLISGHATTVLLPDNGGPVPIIRNAPGYAVQLANDNLVSGLNIDGGAQGILAPSGTINAGIDRVSVQNTSGYGLDFQTTAGTVTVDQYTYNGGATAGGGMQLANFQGTATVSSATLTGGTGPGVNIQNGTGNITFTNSTITDPGNTAFIVSGGSTTVNFTGKISQSNNATTVSVVNNHTGTATFQPMTAGDNVIQAANGNGMQLDNANGTYTFGKLTLNGGDAGVDITGGSLGSFTFTNATITNPAGVAFNVTGGSAAVDFTGIISQNNNAAAVSVSLAHTGTLAFQPLTAGDNVVDATNGTGLQFDDAKGTYTFGQIALHGGDAGIDIVNESNGNFNFNSGTIVNPTGRAVNIDGGTGNISVNATITNNADYSVVVMNKPVGTVTFAGAINDTGAGVLLQNNSGGSVSFIGQVNLNTGANNAVTMSNDHGSAVSFSSLNITTTTGQGFVASGGGSIAVTGTGNTIATGTGIGLNLDGMEIDPGGMNFKSISVNGAEHGIQVQNVTGGAINVGSNGSAAGDGGTLTNTTGDAVVAADVANLSLNYMNITNSGGDGVHVVHTGTNSSSVTVSHAAVSDYAGQGIELAATGTNLMTLNLTNNTLSGATGLDSIHLAVDDPATEVKLTITGNTVNNTAGTSALSLNTSGLVDSKTVTTLIDGNQLNNNSATSATMNIANSGWVTLNATVTNNIATNNDASLLDYVITTTDGPATIHLDLNGNVANSSSGNLNLTQTAGTFMVVDFANVQPNNPGALVNTSGSITNDPDPVPVP
jgi:hypothetical protein